MTESAKNRNVFLHAYKFLKDHWGELYVLYDFFRGFVTKEKPTEDAHPAVKFVHGGKRSIEDEIVYEAIEVEHLSAEERQLLNDFRAWAKGQFGFGFVGKRGYSDFDNEFRQMVMRNRVPGRTEFDTITTKNTKGQDVVTKSERHVPADTKPAGEFLKRLAAQIKAGRDETDGTPEEKLEAGNRWLDDYLGSYNMPNTRWASKAQHADGFIREIPRRSRSVTEKILSGIGDILTVGAGLSITVATAAVSATKSTVKKTVDWIEEQERETETKEASLPWYRKMMRF